jgi:hypothetical protein
VNLSDAALQVTIGTIYNPSSTLPYDIDFIFFYANGSQTTAVGTIQVTQVTNTPINLINYTPTISSISSNAMLIVQTNYFFDYSTILEFTYDPNIVSLDFSKVDLCSVVNISSGTVKLSNWANPNSTQQMLTNTIITNGLLAVDYNIEATLYFESNITNKTEYIQNYSIQFSIAPLPFSSIAATQ